MYQRIGTGLIDYEASSDRNLPQGTTASRLLITTGYRTGRDVAVRVLRHTRISRGCRYTLCPSCPYFFSSFGAPSNPCLMDRPPQQRHDSAAR